MSLNLPSWFSEAASNLNQEHSSLVANGGQAIGAEAAPRFLAGPWLKASSGNQEPAAEITTPQPAPLPDGLAANATALATSSEESKLTDASDTTPLAETADAGQNAAVRETAVRLPFPFNIMKPEDVPEEVWHRARKAQEKNW